MQPVTDPYEPPRARELAVPPLPPDLGRRGAAWFGLPALAGMVIVLAWNAGAGDYDTAADVLRHALFLGSLVALCGAIGRAIGAQCLAFGWGRFLGLAAIYGAVWILAAAAILFGYGVVFEVGRTEGTVLYFIEMCLGIAPLLMPLALLLAIALRAWALRRR